MSPSEEIRTLREANRLAILRAQADSIAALHTLVLAKTTDPNARRLAAAQILRLADRRQSRLHNWCHGTSAKRRAVRIAPNTAPPTITPTSNPLSDRASPDPVAPSTSSAPERRSSSEAQAHTIRDKPHDARATSNRGAAPAPINSTFINLPESPPINAPPPIATRLGRGVTFTPPLAPPPPSSRPPPSHR